MIHNTSYIISDLHLAEGNLEDGITLGTENFFADDEFASFINYIQQEQTVQNSKAGLIINGDFVDFIRMTILPQPNQLDIWQAEIDLTGMSVDVRDEYFSRKEKKYGLKTNDYKSVWKLYCAIIGHPKVFSALAQWVGDGGQLTISAGNHDPEWYWEMVQIYFRKKLWQIAEREQLNHLPQNDFEALIDFKIEPFTIYDDRVWIEHGHTHHKLTKMNGSYELKDYDNKVKPTPHYERELALPFGSFFNRYLINEIEKFFPNVDNLTTPKALVLTLFDEDLNKALRIMRDYGIYSIYAVSRSFWKAILEVGIFLMTVLFPICLLVLLFYDFHWKGGQPLINIPKPFNLLLNPLLNIFLPLAFRELFKIIFRATGLEDPTLEQAGFNILKNKPQDIIVMGHNHAPAHIKKSGKEYINTGCWTEKYVFKLKNVQSGIKYAVAKILFDPKKQTIHTELLEWNHNKTRFKKLKTYKNNKL